MYKRQTLNSNTYLSGTLSSFVATGSAKFNAGLSGSLTRLVDGEAYLVAGANVTIASQSNGQVTIAAGSTSPAGSDRQIQFNDGSSGGFGASANLVFDGGSSLRLTGSMQISSSLEGYAHPLLKIDHENASNILVVTGSGRVGIGTEEPSDKFTVFGNGSTDRVFFLSGSGATESEDESTSPDINFFVSGSEGSKGSATKGTALFGGDLVISGTLHGGSPLKIGDITQFTVQNVDLGSGTSSTITPTAPLIFLDADSVSASQPHELTMATSGFSDGDTVRVVVTTTINNSCIFVAGVLIPSGKNFGIAPVAAGGGQGTAFQLVYVASASKWAVLSTNGLAVIG